MELKLPDLDWQGHGWEASQQTRKIAEESFEVVEAIAQGDLYNAVRETLDIIQTGHTMLSILQADWQKEYGIPLPMNMFLQEHEEKLKRKGYLKEGNYIAVITDMVKEWK